MIVKVPEQRQFPTAGVKGSFDDLVEYLVEEFGLEKAEGFLEARYGLSINNDDEHVNPGFTNILDYTTAGTSSSHCRPDITKQFIPVGDGNFAREGASTTELAFTLTKGILTLHDDKREATYAALQAAKAQGLKEVTVNISPSAISKTGRMSSLARTWVTGQQVGVTVANHVPSEADVIAFKKRKAHLVAPEDKCLAVRTHGVAHLATAIVEMNAVARMRPRVKDPAYHFLLSWPDTEWPDQEKVFDAARHAVRALGLEAHQYVLAIHGNTDNIHCHVAVNRIHPTTFAPKHIEWSWMTLHKAARESEIQHGWSHDNGLFVVALDEQGNKYVVENPNKKKKDGKEYSQHEEHTIRLADIRTGSADLKPKFTMTNGWTDPDSLINWVRKTVIPPLKAILPSLAGWPELHQFLALYNITLKDSGGGGMRITAIDTISGEILDMPANKVLRHLKREPLEARWGAFQAPTSQKGQHTTPWSSDHTDHLTDFDYFDEFDKFGPHPEISRREDLLAKVTTDSNVLPRLLSDSAQDHMDGLDPEHDFPGPTAPPGDRILDTQRPTDQTHQPSPRSATSTPSRQRTPFQFPANAKPTSAARAARLEERTQARIALQRRYREYRATFTEANLAHKTKAAEIRVQQQDERRTLRADLKAEKSAAKAHAQPRSLSAVVPSLAILAMEHRLALHALALEHADQRSAHALTHLPPLAWREWLVEQAQSGDQAALSALRGIVHQANRDRKTESAAQHPDLQAPPPPAATNSTNKYHDTLAAYIAVVEQLHEDEKRETAIRSANLRQVHAYQADPLLISPLNLTYRVTGNGNVLFYDPADRHMFTDRGNRITFDRKTVSDDELQAALLHSREKFDNRITLTGDDPVFAARMARMADDLGMTILNPDMQPIVEAHRITKAVAAAALYQSHRIPKTPSPATAIPATHIEPTARPTPQPNRTDVQESHPDALPLTPPTEPAELLAEPSTPVAEAIAEVSVVLLEITLPTETAQERIRAIILSEKPHATFFTVDPTRATPYSGPVTHTDDQAFAQRVGRYTFAIHPFPIPSDTPTTGTVDIKYLDGQPAYIPPRVRTPKDGGR